MREVAPEPEAGAPGHPGGQALAVEVAYAPQGAPVDLTCLTMPQGSTLAQAVAASGVLERHGLGPAHAAVGIWGRRARPDTRLREGDRVELYRALVCDPKEARRQRQQRQVQPRRRAGARDESPGGNRG